ncbi:MAG TPA: ATP-dependent Clp protease adaptor ClpS [Phycisphaerales bacterium]|nr:ATP-dependent Clp protease adaptor ClpS [Phycisphaerales bacterium]
MAETPGAQTPAPPTLEKQPAKAPPETLPPFKVLLHNDDVNEALYVAATLIALTPLNKQDAVKVMIEAHKKGVALVLTTHKERAELYCEQLASKGLTATCEPA